MQRPAQLGLIASLLLAFVQAPFLHVHDGGTKHAHGFAHAHWATDDSPGLTSSDETGEASSLNWMPGNGKSPVRIAAAVPDQIAIPEPITQTAFVTELKPRNHDPPWRLSLKSRAPPV